MTTLGDDRRARLARARLYLVCDARGDGRDLRAFLDAALRGGVDVVQLREKAGDEDAILRAARVFRAAADAHDALFVLNDRPDLVAAARADGVHVGQDDLPPDAVRRLVGPELIIGLSTHAPEQFDAGLASAADYLSVGPVWETPTKAGRPAAGLDYVRYAAAHATKPWFAIGGLDDSNIGEVVAAGATRAVVVRAIRDAADPGAAASALKSRLTDVEQS